MDSNIIEHSNRCNEDSWEDPSVRARSYIAHAEDTDFLQTEPLNLIVGKNEAVFSCSDQRYPTTVRVFSDSFKDFSCFLRLL